MKTKCRTESPTCFYCDMPLAQQHEHDHYPVPARHDGTETLCACQNCHTLKDRHRIEHQFGAYVAAVMADWPKLQPMTRIFMAKMIGLALDASKALENAS